MAANDYIHVKQHRLIVETLVLCIDRDDDIGRKTGFKGPIIGFEKNLEVAQKLALADPADTDVNAIYGALKIASEVATEVVSLTGDGHVGVVSDNEIARQLDEVIALLKPQSVIFVSDGLDDQQVLPIIQSRVKVNSVQTIVVRQSKELEKAYFKLANFIKEVMGDPALARLIFGLPGIALLLLAAGGIQALSWIMGVVGIYLIIKGFGWEEELFTATGNFIKSLSVERVSTLLYFLALIALALGAAIGYQDLQKANLTFSDITSGSTLSTLGLFIMRSASMNLIFLSFLVAIIARTIDELAVKRFIHVRRYLILAAFITLVAFVLDAGANYMVNEDYWGFLMKGLIGVFALAVWIKVTELMFRSEIRIIEKVMKETEGKEVSDTEGNKLGKVGKAIVESMKLKGIRVGGRTIPNKEIVSIGDVIVVKKEEPVTSPFQRLTTIRSFKFHPPQNLPDFSEAFGYTRRKKK
jgi:putative membrane protein